MADDEEESDAPIDVLVAAFAELEALAQKERKVVL